MKFLNIFSQEMYSEADCLFPYSLDHIQERNNLQEDSKGNMSPGQFVDVSTMTQMEFEESDLFKAPILADISNEGCSQSEDLAADEIALMQGVNLDDELMFYACDSGQDLGRSIAESSPNTPQIAPAQVSSSANNLINFSTEVANTFEDLLNSKPVSICQSPGFLSGSMETDNTISHSVLASGENLAACDSSSLISTSMQSFPDLSTEVKNTVDGFVNFNAVSICQSPGFPSRSVQINDSISCPVLGSEENLAVGNSSSLIATPMQGSSGFSNDVTNIDLYMSKLASMYPSPSFPSGSMEIGNSVSHSILDPEKKFAAGNLSSTIAIPMRTSPDLLSPETETGEALNSKDVFVPKSLNISPAVKRASDSIDHPISSFEETLVSGNSFSPIATYMQNLPKMQRSSSSHELGQLCAYPPVNRTFQYPQSSPVHYPIMEGKPNPQFLDFQGLGIRPTSMPMRRVHSTGDIKSVQGSPRPLESTSSISEDGEFKIGQYTVEERRERLYRYRKKRNNRNFNKKIKYACRKSLADNQPRFRGRFVPKTEIIGRTNAKANDCLEEDEAEVVCLY
ncbi:uncharacterized protein LOC131030628 isoform X1 [Cryptomeria japonica]|uniref:uncharacterized protein LOC131030628 isoform X1 n=1 Tax=Cryptomeria japonica TaxID=3369 RepID=UPI0027DA2EEF|nr:uncharacterized protein LOC131030628 isoform X1 [Cryptomeria japonica]